MFSYICIEEGMSKQYLFFVHRSYLKEVRHDVKFVDIWLSTQRWNVHVISELDRAVTFLRIYFSAPSNSALSCKNFICCL